jgi:hypothetical protein
LDYMVNVFKKILNGIRGWQNVFLGR